MILSPGMLTAIAVILGGFFIFSMNTKHGNAVSAFLFLVIIGLALLIVPVKLAHSEDVNVLRGIGGRVVAPLTGVKREVTKHGAHPIMGDYFATPAKVTRRTIGHSAGADAALRSGAKVIVTIDPTILNQGCPKGAVCTNYYSPLDAFPFIFCCGGYPVRGARNIVVKPNHIAMPETYAVPAVNVLMQ